MAGFDARIASAGLTLGYDVFPFEAFDQAGRLKVPGTVNFPQHIREGIGRIVSSPAWAEIYRTLSVLDDPQWNCYMVGLGHSSRTFNVFIFKSTTSVADAAAAVEWGQSYQTTVAKSLKSFVGRQHLIDPSWIQAATEALDLVESGENRGGDNDALPRLAPGSDAPEPLSMDDEVLVSPTALAAGLRFFVGFLGRLTRSTEIRTTVFWYAPSGRQPIGIPFAQAWQPLHIDYMWDGSIRSVHGVWEPRQVPHLIKGAAVDWDLWLWRMPHQLWEWCRAFYPTLNCGSGLSNIDGQVAIEVAPGAAIPTELEGIILSEGARD